MCIRAETRRTMILLNSFLRESWTSGSDAKVCASRFQALIWGKTSVKASASCSATATSLAAICMALIRTRKAAVYKCHNISYQEDKSPRPPEQCNFEWLLWNHEIDYSCRPVDSLDEFSEFALGAVLLVPIHVILVLSGVNKSPQLSLRTPGRRIYLKLCFRQQRSVAFLNIL